VQPSEHLEEKDNNNPERIALPKDNNLLDTDSNNEKDMKILPLPELKEDTIQQNTEHIENWIENIKNVFKLAKVADDNKVEYIKL
jgi:hypothetical protein